MAMETGARVDRRLSAAAGPAAGATFVPWEPLVGDNWICFDPGEPKLMVHTVNGGDCAVGFDQAKGDDSARGMNALQFSYAGASTGHLASAELQGSFQVRNAGSKTFADLLLLVAIDAERLPKSFTFSLGLHGGKPYVFDTLTDLGYYDPKGCDAGRPSGYYSATDPPAFTLTELPVSLTIVAMLACLLVPFAARAHDRARLTVCQTRLRNLSIGLDDTDNPASRGTGFLARGLMEELVRHGGRSLGVTRHQFLVDRRIPYTSHNSGACLAVEVDAVDPDLPGAVCGFVADRSAAGSDPAVCIAELPAVPQDATAFGRRAAAEVLHADEALDIAARAGMVLRPLGGTGLGVIGALAAAGLRADGNDGRFIDLPGLRDLRGRVRAEQIQRLGIRLEPAAGRSIQPGDVCQTLDWLRPRLVGGRPSSRAGS